MIIRVSENWQHRTYICLHQMGEVITMNSVKHGHNSLDEDPSRQTWSASLCAKLWWQGHNLRRMLWYLYNVGMTVSLCHSYEHDTVSIPAHLTTNTTIRGCYYFSAINKYKTLILYCIVDVVLSYFVTSYRRYGHIIIQQCIDVLVFKIKKNIQKNHRIFFYSKAVYM